MNVFDLHEFLRAPTTLDGGKRVVVCPVGTQEIVKIVVIECDAQGWCRIVPSTQCPDDQVMVLPDTVASSKIYINEPKWTMMQRVAHYFGHHVTRCVGNGWCRS